MTTRSTVHPGFTTTAWQREDKRQIGGQVDHSQYGGPEPDDALPPASPAPSEPGGSATSYLSCTGGQLHRLQGLQSPLTLSSILLRYSR